MAHNIFASNKDIGDIRTYGVGRQNHALNQLVRIAFHQQPILKGAGLHLIGIAHQISYAPGCIYLRMGTKLHFIPVGKPAPPRPRKIRVR